MNKYAIYSCIMIFIVILILFFGYKKRSKTNDKLIEIQNKIKDIDPIVKTLVFTESNESYTLNKKYVHLCMRDKNGNYYDDNMLIYVALHEVAHALSNEVIEDKNNHTKDFFSIFTDLLKKAEKMGIYNPSIKPIQHYCNL
jgi:hypothetical protein